MKGTIKNQFLKNYIIMFVISTIIALVAFLLLDFADDVISKTLVKNKYTAEILMQDDYTTIDTAPVIKNGGGVQVIDRNYDVVFSSGLNTFEKRDLSAAEFTEFLTQSRKVGIPYSYSIEYNPEKKFWLVVTFPTSIRIDFAIVHNWEAASRDMDNVAGVLVAVLLLYLLLLAVSTVAYSKITSLSIINPLRSLCATARRLRDGDYSARVDLNLQNEFGELQDAFNSMADRIQREISLRKQSEENRKKLVLDISHDLKNPLASIMGYAELCRDNKQLSKEELESYLKIIHENSSRANQLIVDLFELSKMESSEFKINKSSIDVSEYLRETMGAAIPLFDQAGFAYEFAIPEREIAANIDTGMMDRVFQNLVQNVVQYNPRGTKVTVSLTESTDDISITFKDDGVGMPEEIAEKVFQPFVRADSSRNSQTGGTGLGLAIVEKIVSAHGGSISLETAEGRGCEFLIRLPKI